MDAIWVWLALLLALAVASVLIVRRTSALAAQTHELERFQRAVDDLNGRFATTVDPLFPKLDEVRRRSGDPAALSDAIPEAAERLRLAASEADALRAPAGLVDRPPALVHDLERATRALELVEHGLDAILTGRGPRQLEAETSLKRGALNLRHAREAFALTASEVSAVRPADLQRPPFQRAAIRRRATEPTPAEHPAAADEASEHRI